MKKIRGNLKEDRTLELANFKIRKKIHLKKFFENKEGETAVSCIEYN